MSTVILIPAYEPDHRLTDLVAAVLTADPCLDVVVVDDGSRPAYEPVFARAQAVGALVLRHAVNRGKGAALKTGLAHIEADHPGADVVCADCDGQHRPADILAVARHVAADGVMVLGARTFSGRVPLRSRVGNGLTRGVFLLATGRHLSDTQTGLRGYPASMLTWLRGVGGERFEYELELLLQAGPAGHRIEEVEIETVYLEGNASSHFRPVADSLRVYRPLLAFGASSLGAFLTDAIGLFMLMALTGNLLASVIGARMVSAAVNYLTNRRYVFSRHDAVRPARGSAARYAGLVVAVMLANYALMHLLVERLSVPLVVAKTITETGLFVLSYRAQRRVVFAPQRTATPETTTEPTSEWSTIPRSATSDGALLTTR